MTFANRSTRFGIIKIDTVIDHGETKFFPSDQRPSFMVEHSDLAIKNKGCNNSFVDEHYMDSVSSMSVVLTMNSNMGFWAHQFSPFSANRFHL